MKILVLCYEYPSPSIAGSHRVLYSLEYLSKKYGHDITLAAFRLSGRNYPDLSSYCRIETVDITCRPGLGSSKAVASALKNTFSPYNLLSGRFSLDHSYSREMHTRIKTLLRGGFDIVLADHPAMLCYLPKKGIPIVLLETFILSEIARVEYELEENWLKKIMRLLYFYRTKGYAKSYRITSVSIAVSAQQRDAVKLHCPDLNIEVVPPGIDMGDDTSVEPETAFPSLVISGSMSGVANKRAVLRFCNEIYPLIKARVPQVKLYIVGRDPDKEIQQLAADESIAVTGYVEDLRPYLSRAWVIVSPLLEGHGIKVRVLQAMAMGKPVVASSMVTQGIDVSPEENIIIADEPLEFAEKVIELLNDRQQRERIGSNAKLLMETNHNWEKLTDRLNGVLVKAAGTSSEPADNSQND